MSNTLQELKTILQRLNPIWAPYLKTTQGLDLNAEDLAEELGRELTINREVPGFEDFFPEGDRGAAPGDPAASLLYHAFASPNVRPDGASSADYPTWADLDVLENYIYSLKPITASELENAVVAVFAYQYRPLPATTHQLYADLAYSRMGFSRVGNAEPLYRGGMRSFDSYTGNPGELAVIPARYGAFLAEWRSGCDECVSMIGEEVAGDSERKFLYPLRKLFPGDECFEGGEVALNFSEWHLNSKLARVVGGEGTPDGKPMSLPAGLDASLPPYRRHSPDPELSVITPQGPASVLIRPPAAKLVRVAKQYNTETKRDEIARFKVSPAVSPTVTDVVTTVKGSPTLLKLVDEVVEVMRLTAQFEPVEVGSEPSWMRPG